MKTNNIYKEIAEDFETMFDTSNYKLNGSLPKGTNKKVIGARKDKLGGKIVKEFLGLRAKYYSYLIDDGSKGQKNNIIKRKLKFEDYENFLEATQIKNKINHQKTKFR